jgi:hypothetical protein
MSHKTIHRLSAVIVFFSAFIVYLLSLSSTVVFWDVGEFIASAKMLQVPHPPGSPLFVLWAHIAMMLPIAKDMAVRAHLVSALASSVGVTFTYLVCVRVITNFRGVPGNFIDKLAVYGGSVIGALSLAYGTTYWDNSIEAEVYGASMLFLTITMWLTMRWLERADSEGNEKYILFMAYLMGLSLGVHLLQLLAIFPILLIMYFKKYEFNRRTFIRFCLVALAIFAVVYPGIVKYLPGMMDGEFWGKKSDVIAAIPWLIIAGVSYGVYWSYKHHRKMLHIGLVSILLIFIGYTTYTSVLIRSNADPPMNENNPNNLARLTSYLGREQYGDQPFWPRRYSQEAQHQGIYTNYTSEWDFMIRYQLNHMFFRYVGWNYIGAAGDEQEAGVRWRDTLGVPLLVGLLGLYYQFKKDWKMGLVFLTMFIIMGPVLALYQGQQDPQPRERDYFYVGAFFVLSLWVAIGVVALIDYLRTSVQSAATSRLLSSGVVGLLVFAIPVNMVRMNWESHDRTGNYVAWDYSYNLLQTCEKDAILFTNGDNDTFPLWYLQDVEGIRRDVRVVCLSLVNTPWYIQQMKKKPYYPEAKAVPISLSDAQIARIEPVQWDPTQIDLPVPHEVFERYGVTDTSITNRGKISFMMKNTRQFGDTKAILVQDLMVYDIVMTTKWTRPIYFGTGVPSGSRVGLDDYLWFEGLAWKLKPKKVDSREQGIDADVLEANLFHEPEGFSRTPRYGYKFRNVGNPKIHFEEESERYVMNYRSAFLYLSMDYANVKKDTAKALETLLRMEQIVPRSKIPMNWELSADVAMFFHRFGRDDKFNEIANDIEPVCQHLIDTKQFNLNTYYNPFRVLLDIYDARKDYAKSLDVLKNLSVFYPNDPGLKQRMGEVQAKLNLPSQNGTKPSDSL